MGDLFGILSKTLQRHVLYRYGPITYIVKIKYNMGPLNVFNSGVKYMLQTHNTYLQQKHKSLSILAASIIMHCTYCYCNCKNMQRASNAVQCKNMVTLHFLLRNPLEMVESNNCYVN